MGRNIVGRNVLGATCPWGELSMGRVVHGASSPWGEFSMGEMTVGRNVMGQVSWNRYEY
jgi:hypothetical protein